MLYAPTGSFTPGAPIAVRETSPRTADKISSLGILFQGSTSKVVSELVYDRTIDELRCLRYAIDIDEMCNEEKKKIANFLKINSASVIA